MKKKVLGVIALVSLLILPFARVNASGVVASTATSWSAVNSDNSTFTAPSDFSGSFELKQSDKSVTIFANILEGETIPKDFVLSGSVNFSNSKYAISACEAITSKTNYDVSCSVSGTSVTFTAKASKDITGPKQTKLATINIDSTGATSADVCEISMEISGEPGETPVTPKCTTGKNGEYYDNNGNQVTKEEYEKACSSENPQTGSAVSYVIIVGGIALAVAAFMMTKKSKIYNV